MCAEDNLVVNNKDNTMFVSSIFCLEASLLWQIFVLRTSNFLGGNISRQKTHFCFNKKSRAYNLFNRKIPLRMRPKRKHVFCRKAQKLQEFHGGKEFQ